MLFPYGDIKGLGVNGDMISFDEQYYLTTKNIGDELRKYFDQ